MTGVEMILLLAGCVFMVGSFFITEKLSPSELNKIAELSEEELKNIVNREIDNAGEKIQDAILDQLDASADIVERALEKETNEKIMAISEYSDTVIENMNQTHNEIMFLYSMLNDKHAELTEMVSDLQRIAADVRNLKETAGVLTEQPVSKEPEQKAAVSLQQQPVAKTASPVKSHQIGAAEKDNHNQEILLMHREGLSEIEIARRLGLGVGEVKLVIGLYRGELNL